MNKRKEFFDDLAQQWDEEHNTDAEKLRTREFARAHFPVHEAETVLDIGCGTGRLIPYLTEVIGGSGKLIELDISLSMLHIGKKRHNLPNLLFVQGDGHVLPLKDHSMDTVICMAFFPHFSDKLKGLMALARVLKPGGRLFIAHQMNREELNRFHGNVSGPVGNDLLPDENSMRELFKKAGFGDVETREEPGLYLAAAHA